MSDRLRIAVVGVGAFGRQHARVIAGLAAADLTAVYDADPARAEQAAAEFGCAVAKSWDEVADRADAATVAAPTSVHAEAGIALLERGLDVLVEKPLAPDLADADGLIEAAAAHRRILQVGHLERFNPAVEAAFEAARLPLFFEVHRLSVFSPRSLDVDVVLDLMIHDLDIVLAMTTSPLERIEAAGIPILSARADIASVRLVFENGCVANLTASRVSTEKVRKLRYFQPRQYVSIDYARQDGVAIGVDDQNRLQFRPLQAQKGEPLERQLAAFAECVRTRATPRVDGAAARRALEAALRIRAEMERHARTVEAAVARFHS